MTVTIRKSVGLKAILALLGTASMVSPVLGFDGLTFEHKDWYLACDNTGTCRAAGYAAVASDFPINLVFTREAGGASNVSVKVNVGEREPNAASLQLSIDEQDLGPVQGDMLTSMQVQALLAVMTKDVKIQFSDGEFNWLLSGSGASAVFRKMDEYQGRAGSPFAVVVKGHHPESRVKPAQPMPEFVVENQADLQPIPQDSALYAMLRPQLIASAERVYSDACPLLSVEENPEISMASLGDGLVLYEASCWLAAYNYGVGYWLAEKGGQTDPQLLTYEATGYADGVISMEQKGRGVGDCVSFERWIIKEGKLQQVSAGNTGLCRGLAGGAGAMPTYVSKLSDSAFSQ